MPHLGVHWVDSSGARRWIAAGAHEQRATVVRVADRRFLALPDRDRVLLVRPEDGAIAAAIPFLGQVNDVVSPAPGLLCLIVAARVALVELADDLS
ncbi:hypothetical protein AB0D57_01575 [Streptomyces sp. NPDC048275]|uniref:hypothetical protein n=1 Tax=Streptomyces sp. NPDC048275 TaxID=3155629 RepID=UPI0033F5446D